MKRLTWLLILLFACRTVIRAASPADITSSRNSTVRIRTSAGSGSGFILDSTHIATCFHVIGIGSFQKIAGVDKVTWTPYENIVVDLPSGESISAEVSSIPTPADASPIVFDFAVLKLRSMPRSPGQNVTLLPAGKEVSVGENVIFSGFPLSAPGMVTHRGMISGTADSGARLFIQASTNKGNSGGALLNSDGEVVGIVSMREGQISEALEAVSTSIIAGEKRGRIIAMGIDPLQAIKELIAVLDRYISTGIGYARHIGHLQGYLNRYPQLLK